MKPNPLMIVAVVFAASFAGRTIGFANAALNRAEDAPKTPESHLEDAAASHAPAELTADVQDGAAAAQPSEEKKAAGNDYSEPVSSSHKASQNSELLNAIQERSETIDKKAMRVEDRIRVLEIIETRVEQKLDELRKNNEDLSKLVSYANEASQEDITLLARMYEQMKPQKAGEIFDKMNPTFAAGFLTEMNSESAALILTNMSTDKAYETSMIIASRNAAVHQQ